MAEILSYLCPTCGSEVRVGSPCSGCPTQPTWSQPKSHDGLDLPDDSFDYDAFVAREFGPHPHHRTQLPWYWWTLAILVLAGLIIALF